VRCMRDRLHHSYIGAVALQCVPYVLQYLGQQLHSEAGTPYLFVTWCLVYRYYILMQLSISLSARENLPRYDDNSARHGPASCAVPSSLSQIPHLGPPHSALSGTLQCPTDIYLATLQWHQSEPNLARQSRRTLGNWSSGSVSGVESVCGSNSMGHASPPTSDQGLNPPPRSATIDQ
jgi:hypothetical protein